MVAEVLAKIYRASEIHQRNCALLTALILAVCVGLIAWGAFSFLAGAYEQLQERRYYLGNLHLVIGAARDANMSAPAAVKAIEGDFFLGDNKDVVSAQIQAWFGNAVAEAGAQLQSIEILQPGGADEQNAVALAASIAGSWKTVQNVILRVETARPVLFVKSADIQSSSFGDAAAESQVSMMLVFSGTMKSPAQKVDD